MKLIHHSPDRFEAEVVKGSLENEGFHPVIFDNTMNSIYPLPLFVESLEQIRVMVPDEEFEAAQEFLRKPNDIL